MQWDLFSPYLNAFDRDTDPWNTYQETRSSHSIRTSVNSFANPPYLRIVIEEDQKKNFRELSIRRDSFVQMSRPHKRTYST